MQSYGSDELDASLLIMPLVSFVSPTDPRMLSTIDAILRSPAEGGLTVGGLVYRYPPERAAGTLDSKGQEGTFTLCSC